MKLLWPVLYTPGLHHIGCEDVSDGSKLTKQDCTAAAVTAIKPLSCTHCYSSGVNSCLALFSPGLGSQVVDALCHAASDEDVHGLAAHLPGSYGNQAVSSLADIQELRSAILQFRFYLCRVSS